MHNAHLIIGSLDTSPPIIEKHPCIHQLLTQFHPNILVCTQHLWQVYTSASNTIVTWSKIALGSKSLSNLYTTLHITQAPRIRARPNISYGFGAETAKFFCFDRNSHFGFGLVLVTAVTRKLVSVSIVMASRNSDIEFGKHRIILHISYLHISYSYFPNPVSAWPFAKLACCANGVVWPR